MSISLPPIRSNLPGRGNPAPSVRKGKIMPKTQTPQDRYHKAHTVSLTIRLMKNTEQDILEKLDSVPNKAGYIKRLIRADLEKSE